jgi:hypothetical protein
MNEDIYAKGGKITYDQVWRYPASLTVFRRAFAHLTRFCTPTTVLATNERIGGVIGHGMTPILKRQPRDMPHRLSIPLNNTTMRPLMLRKHLFVLGEQQAFGRSYSPIALARLLDLLLEGEACAMATSCASVGCYW